MTVKNIILNIVAFSNQNSHNFDKQRKEYTRIETQQEHQNRYKPIATNCRKLFRTAKIIIPREKEHQNSCRRRDKSKLPDKTIITSIKNLEKNQKNCQN